jgi:YVTN family beta-propeller protein
MKRSDFLAKGRSGRASGGPPPRLARALVFVGAVGWLGACSGGGEPAAGPVDAFPNRRPQYEAPGHLLGYVANRSSDTISVLDLDQMAVVGTAPVGLDPVENDGPRHVIVDPSADVAYVVVAYPQSVPGSHDTAAGATERASYLLALALSDFSLLGQLRLDPQADEMALSTGGAQLDIVHDDTLRALQPVDVAQRRAALDLVADPAGLAGGTPAVRSVTVCVAPTSVASVAGNRAYVACSGEDTLAVVDTANAVVLAQVPAGSANVNQPYAVVADPSGQRLLVSNQVARTAVLFTASDAPVATATFSLTGVPTFAVWIADDQVLVPTQSPSGIARLDTTTGAVVQAVSYSDDVCLNPSEASVSPDGRLFLVCEADHYAPGAVVQLDPETLGVVASVPVGIYPDRLAFRPP